jgi:hypothetical protein
MSDAALGAIILVPFVIGVYVLARVASALGDARGAHLLAPLAPAVQGEVSRDGPHVTGLHRGRRVRLSFTPGQSVGSGEGALSFNAFHTAVLDVAGEASWRVRFYPTSLLGNEKRLHIESKDAAFADRLHRSGALDAIAAVSTPSHHYVVAEFDARSQALTCTDDVSPRKVPTDAQLTRYLDLATYLADLNARLDPPGT